jgi:DNA polymerase
MGIASQIQLDTDVLHEEIRTQTKRRNENVAASGHPLDVLVSNQKFETLLEDLIGSEEIPRKVNKNGDTTPAFSKTDAGWVKLKLDHPELAPLLLAREEAKSNIMIKRPERFLQLAALWPHTLPMAYNFAGAHTFRWSGADGLNVQNLPSLRRSNIRRALVAPEGCVIHVCDFSQIELRMQLWFSGQTDKLLVLAEGGDLYSMTASNIFGVPIVQVPKYQRGVGKATDLGAQYRMGGRRYRAYLAGGPLGLDPVFLSESEAYAFIQAYRTGTPMTVQMWDTLDHCIPLMTDPKSDQRPFALGPIEFHHLGIKLPNGTMLDFSGLHQTEDGNWMYGRGNQPKFLHGGSLLENLIQSLARIPVGTAALAIKDELSHCVVAGWTHDEILTIGPEKTADEDFEHIRAIHLRRPAWAPDLPLDAEGGWSRCYEK